MLARKQTSKQTNETNKQTGGTDDVDEMKLESGLKRFWLLFGSGIVRFLLAVQSPFQINCVLFFWFLYLSSLDVHLPLGKDVVFACLVCSMSALPGER